MKRGTPDHPKTKKLMRRLRCGKIEAVGLLEQLFHFTGEFCPDGDLSKYSPEDLASSLEWAGEGADMVTALDDSDWLDVLPACARFVHDWPEHADNAIHMKLARAGRYFADGTIPNINRLAGKERESAALKYGLECDTTSANDVSMALARHNQAVRTASVSRAARQSPAPPEPRQSPAPPEPAGEQNSAEVQQQPEPEQPTPPAFPDLKPDEPEPDPGIRVDPTDGTANAAIPKPPRPGPPHLEPIRDALADATGLSPDAAIVADLAYAGAKLGAHPATVAKWIFRKARARGAIRSNGFFVAALPTDLPPFVGGEFGYGDVVSRVACQCGKGEAIQFADCIVAHACPTMPRGLKRLAVAVTR